MAVGERLSLPLPYGQRAVVVSDLDLCPRSDPDAAAVREFAGLLDDIDDAATVIVAGNLFAPEVGADPATFMDETMANLPVLRRALERFTAEPFRRIVVLPGAHDGAIIADDEVAFVFSSLGVELASEVMVHVATATGVRDVLVVAGASTVELGSDREDNELDDRSALASFRASRYLYRSLARWIWFPLFALIILDTLSLFVAAINHVTHRHLHLRPTHPAGVVRTVLIDLIVLVTFEAILVAIAAYVVRRRFDRSTPPAGANDPLELTHARGVDALELARRVAQRGGAGVVIGGCAQPALAFLDRGMCAAPGPSRNSVVERRSLIGLPPVFCDVERLGAVEILAGASVRVRLVARARTSNYATRLERWSAGAARTTLAPEELDTIASWPDNEPWPQREDALRQQRRRRSVRRWGASLLLVVGVADVAVAVAPPLRQRLHDALSVLPIGVVQGAAAITAIAGIALIMLARGVRRGQRRAWAVAVATLVVTVGTHLVRGGSVIGSLLALVVLGVLVVGREHFAARSDRASLPATLPRLGLIALIAVVAATIGVEVSDIHHKALPAWPIVMLACTERLVGITTIALPDRIGDFVDPAMLAVGMTLLITALYLATRPVVDRRLSENATSTERRLAERRARDIVRRHGRGTLDYFALRDDKQFFFHRDSLVAYAVYGGVALLSPDPIGPVTERREVFSHFRAFAESRGWTIGIMAASEQWLPIYQEAGLRSIYLGDEAIVDCQTFSLAGGQMKGLRQAVGRLAKKGYTVSFHDPATIEPSEILSILELIAKLRRGEGERGFSMMLGRLFDPRDEGLLLTLVKDPNGVPAAVCQFVPSPAVNGFSLDLMRRDPDEHPNGLIDYALCSTIDKMRSDGNRGLSLNFAAFRSVLDGERGEGTFTRVERWALKRLSGVLPIESLWLFNAKYQPSWLPRYLVYPAAESFVPVVSAILRAEAITEIPVIGRLLAQDPSNRPGTVVPEEVLELARGTSRD